MTATRGAHGARAIVVGTDFSRSAHNAVARATQIAAANGATLHIVHASQPLPRALARTFGATDERMVRSVLRAALHDARSAGVAARSHHLTAGVTRGLLRSVRQLRPALVVVGARGRSIRDAIVGSTAERLASFGRRPVLLVRRAATRPYRDVVIAADATSDVADAAAAASFVAPSARRSVLHAYEGPFEYRLRLNGAGAADMRLYRAAVRREAHAAMSKVLREAGVDEALLDLQHGSAPRVLRRVGENALLVINRHGPLAHQVLLGSTTRFVIAHGRSDVLIV
jgi:nucleotide-binding universal stress UspA family protein